jgi:hypothetical protein
MKVAIFLLLSGVLPASAPSQQAARADTLRVLVHSGDEEAKGLLRRMTEEAAAELAGRLGYDVIRSPSAIIFVPKPAWSMDATSVLEGLLERTRSGHGTKFAASALEPAERQHLLRFLRSTKVGGDLGSQMRATPMKEVSVEREMEIVFRRDGKFVRVPIRAEKLSWAFANPAAQPNPLFGYASFFGHLDRPAAPAPAGAPVSTPDPLARPQLYGLMSEGFSLGTSRPLPPEEFGALVDHVQVLISERRETRAQRLTERLADEFGALFRDGQGREMLNGAVLGYEQLPPAVRGVLAEAALGRAMQFGIEAGPDQRSALVRELTRYEVSFNVAGQRVFMLFHVGAVGDESSPAERWVGFTFNEIALRSP